MRGDEYSLTKFDVTQEKSSSTRAMYPAGERRRGEAVGQRSEKEERRNEAENRRSEKRRQQRRKRNGTRRNE